MTHSPRFLKKRITQAVASLTAALAAAGTFVEARCFLCAYREAVPCIFFVMFGLFSLSVMFGLEPDISLTDSPVKPGNDEKEKKLRNDEKEKKLRNDEKEKKAGNDNKKRRTGNDRRKRKYEHGGRKNKPGVCKRSGEKCKATGLLSLIRGFL